MKIDQNPESRVEQHATWLAVNPILGCPYNCQYCFLGPDNLRPVKPKLITTPETTIDMLKDHKFYDPTLPVAIGVRTDMFASPANQQYVNDWLGQWEKNEMSNPLVFITKAKIPENIISRLSALQDKGFSFLVFLSMSGLDNQIEKGVRHEQLYSNIPVLKDFGVKTIHYWRPLMPQNSTFDKLEEMHSRVRGNLSSSFVGGLRLTPEMLTQLQYTWPEIMDIDIEKLDSLWEENGYINIQRLQKLYPYHPIYESNSCTIANALSIPEKNGVYGTDVCLRNNCPEKQRTICANAKASTPNEVSQVLATLGLDTAFSLDERHITIESELGLDEVTNLTLRTGMTVRTIRTTESTYGWGSHHNRQSVFIRSKETTKNQSIFGLDINQLEDIRISFYLLKKEFSKTETKPWDALTVSNELLIQLGHLIQVNELHNLRDRFNPQLNSEIDELSDIFFNLCNALSFLDINFIDIKELINCKQPQTDNWLNQLFTYSTILSDSIAKKLGYKAYIDKEEPERLNLNIIFASLFNLLNSVVSHRGLNEAIVDELDKLVIKSRKFINEQ